MNQGRFALALASALLGCASTNGGNTVGATEPASASSTSDPAPAAQEPALANEDTVPVVEPAPSAGYAVTVLSHSHGPTGPGSGPVTLQARPELNAIAIDIANLTTYCEPAPAFSSTVAGETLTLTLARPTAPSRCFAPHELRLRVDLPGRNNVRNVVLVRDDGSELGAAVVSSAASRESGA